MKNLFIKLFKKHLEQFYDFKAKYFLSKYRRLVPFGDMISDRWNKAYRLGFGEGTSIYDSSLVLGDVKVGKNTWIGPQTILDGYSAPLTIGDYCSISSGVQIYTHSTVKWSITGGIHKNESAPVSIGSNVYIGPQTIISKGVSIGNRVIIGACSYVDKPIPDFSVAWGQPAKIIGQIIMNADKSDFEIRYL
ncbi:MAG: acyltransferase [Synergistaceae bacterium]|nr:acyltransferase [Synergistaceae bacterium]